MFQLPGKYANSLARRQRWRLSLAPFLNGTFIFNDTIERTFAALFADVYGESTGTCKAVTLWRPSLVSNVVIAPAEIVDEVRAVPGLSMPRCRFREARS